MGDEERDGSVEATTLDALPDVVLMATYEPSNGELIVQYANEAAERILARTRAQMVGQPIRALLSNRAPFELRPEREAFLEQVRKAGTFEVPALMAARDASGQIRRVRARFCWPAGGNMVVGIGEDVTDRAIALEQAGALERLRSARDVSGLLGHYVNDALTVALMSIEDARHAASRSQGIGGVAETLAQAVEAVQSASSVLVGLSAATDVDADLEESANLEDALRAEWDGTGQRLRMQASDLPRFVWGSTAQIRMILAGFRPLLGDEVEARIHGGEKEVLLQLRTSAALDDWLPLLIDPTALTYSHDGGGRSVRLFASVQVLHAVGGRLGMPSRDADGLRIELSFRAAPGKVDVAPRPSSVLLVSGDGALRAMLRTQLEPHPLFFTDDIREGIAWLMRPRAGVVICDMDQLRLTPAQLLGLQRMLAAAHSRRVILAARGRPPDDSIPLPQVTIPTDRERLLELVAAADV